MKTKGQRRRPLLRPGYEFMEPGEMTPEERLDQIIELLTIMCLAPERKDEDQPAAS